MDNDRQFICDLMTAQQPRSCCLVPIIPQVFSASLAVPARRVCSNVTAISGMACGVTYPELHVFHKST